VQLRGVCGWEGRSDVAHAAAGHAATCAAAREAATWPCSCEGDGDVAHAAERRAVCAAAMGAAMSCVQLRGVLPRSPCGCEVGSDVAVQLRGGR
jgi:hypothetical protein